MKPKGFQGWSFTPSQAVIECGTTECNSGKDLIFEVNGFSIHGKITGKQIDGCSENQRPALDSILVHLHQEGPIILLDKISKSNQEGEN